MFDLFKKKGQETPADVKGIRSALLQFIKEQLQKAEGGEGANIKGLQLFLFPGTGEKHLYEAAVYSEEENRFKNEDIQKIADDYAIELPASWTLDMTFVDSVPDEAIKAANTNAALIVHTLNKPVVHKGIPAFVKVLHGEADKEIYPLTPEKGKINIGREKKVQTESGFHRVNTIAFTADSAAESNRSVSRQHAHIEWDAATGIYLLFADEGGVPPRNKVKVRSVGGEPVKLQTTAIGHVLQEGDQIIIGESALLEFSYSGTTI